MRTRIKKNNSNFTAKTTLSFPGLSYGISVTAYFYNGTLSMSNKVLDKVQNFNFRWSEVRAFAEDGVPWRCLVSVTRPYVGFGT